MANDWVQGIKAGSTDITINLMIRKASDALGKTGLIFSDMTGSYARTRGARVAISMNTLAAVDSAHTDGGFKEIDSSNMPGEYRFDIPDAAFASGVDMVDLFLTTSGGFEWTLSVPIVDTSILNSVDIGAISGDTTAADNMELDYDGTGYAKANSTVGTVTDVTNQVSANVTAISGDTTAADTLEAMCDGSTTGAVVADGSNTSATFKTGLSEATDATYVGAILWLTSGDLQGESKTITAYNGTTKFITVAGGFTGIPADAVTFIIV